MTDVTFIYIYENKGNILTHLVSKNNYQELSNFYWIYQHHLQLFSTTTVSYSHAASWLITILDKILYYFDLEIRNWGTHWRLVWLNSIANRKAAIAIKTRISWNAFTKFGYYMIPSDLRLGNTSTLITYIKYL